jgi:hypothetical protein
MAWNDSMTASLSLLRKEQETLLDLIKVGPKEEYYCKAGAGRQKMEHQ